MKLSLRKGAAVGGDWIEKAAAWIIKARLVTDYPHSGIVIGDTLYHATARHGLISEPFAQENWELFDAGGDDAAALALFEEHKGAKYDWFSLLAFVLIPSSDSDRFYCFEWSFMAMTGKNPNNKVIPEGLLEIVVRK